MRRYHIETSLRWPGKQSSVFCHNHSQWAGATQPVIVLTAPHMLLDMTRERRAGCRRRTCTPERERS